LPYESIWKDAKAEKTCVGATGQCSLGVKGNESETYLDSL